VPDETKHKLHVSQLNDIVRLGYAENRVVYGLPMRPLTDEGMHYTDITEKPRMIHFSDSILFLSVTDDG